MTPDQARSEAKRLLGLVETGFDPVAERRAARGTRTFKDVAEDFLRLHVATKRKGRTFAEYSRILHDHILPVIGQKGIKEISKADAARIHAKMASTPYQANMALKITSSVWNWAESRDEVSGSNPCSRLEHFPERSRRYLSSDELARLGDALRTAKIGPYSRAAIRLLILTGARLREVLHAKWSEVDFERGALFLPDSKTGRKTIYLAALEILNSLPRIDGNPHIIPGALPGRPRTDLHSPWLW
jgi:integrase